jgi:CheY-like chemotaxis protein
VRSAVTIPEAAEIAPKRILLVDDEASLRAVVAETLRGEGYLVDEAPNGAEGLDRLEAARPDLILLDLAMPVLDGRGFMQAYRAKIVDGDIPIIILSATPALWEAPQEDGVKAVLVKPFDLGILMTMVDRMTQAAGLAPT